MQITFYINGTQYKAEEGMTWENWVNSNYNTISAYIVYEESAAIRHDINNETYVINSTLPSDNIVENTAYASTKYWSSGGWND